MKSDLYFQKLPTYLHGKNRGALSRSPIKSQCKTPLLHKKTTGIYFDGPGCSHRWLRLHLNTVWFLLVFPSPFLTLAFCFELRKDHLKQPDHPDKKSHGNCIWNVPWNVEMSIYWWETTFLIVFLSRRNNLWSAVGMPFA